MEIVVALFGLAVVGFLGMLVGLVGKMLVDLLTVYVNRAGYIGGWIGLVALLIVLIGAGAVLLLLVHGMVTLTRLPFGG